MTDRELLELAAKAISIDISDATFDGWGTPIQTQWNPLRDDGDAFRLAVKLGIDLVISTSSPARTAAFIPESFELDACVEENHENDPYAATRHAIVRAAAEVGKGMK